jgi:hypothetical protein
MKNIFLLIVILVPAICFAQACKHVRCSPFEHYGSGEIYPFAEQIKIDATHTIVYSRVRYFCKICRQWYEEKANIDTLGIDAPQLDQKNKTPGKVITVAEFKRRKAQETKTKH